MKRAPLLLGVAALVAIARADANAPPDQYALFGSAVDAIKDNYTRLVWQRAVTSGGMKQSDGVTYCLGATFGGETGARLPTYKELMTIVDEGLSDDVDINGTPLKLAVDVNAFPGTPNAPFWSSTVVPNDATRGYVVDFATGEGTSATRAATAYVRCVRDAP